MTDFSLITVSDFRAMAPDVDLSRFDDPTISGFIAAASKQASDYLEYNPLAEDIADELVPGMITTEYDLLIMPKKIPVVSVSEIELVRGATAITLNLTSVVNGQTVNRCNIDYSGRNIRYPYEELTVQGSPIFMNFFNLRGAAFYTRLTYRAGFEVSALPASIKQAVALLCRDLFANQYNSTGASSIQQGGLSLEFRNSKSESKLVKDAKRLLGPYRRV